MLRKHSDFRALYPVTVNSPPAAVKVQRQAPPVKGYPDMRQLRRIGLTYYARLTIPRDRWKDAGKVTGAKTGEKRELVRTLETRDLKEAIKRRPKALEAMREQLDEQLAQAGLQPLADGWAPNWQAEALRAREEIRKASDERRQGDYPGEEYPSIRDAKLDQAFERAEELGARLGDKTATAYLAIVTASSTPIRLTADRWLKDIAGAVTKQTASQHERSLNLLAEFLVGRDGGNPKTILGATGLEAITRRVAGEFVEWLQQRKGLNPKTVASRVSALSMLWKWSDRKGVIEGQNPWVGQTTGLKRKADALKPDHEDERAYEPEELVQLLRANPSEGRKWTYGAALFDLLRLGLLTGARQNELASLTRRDLLPDLVGIQVRSEVAKTKASVRRIPLHPLAQAILRDRLRDLPASTDPAAPLFPECPPGGPDAKRSWHFSKKFTEFREAVLGPNAALDYHSLRRTFSTYLAAARIQGVSEASQDVQDDLMGHKRQALAGNTYTAKDLGWVNYGKAIMGMVEKGMPEEVLVALQETQGHRPALPRRILRPRLNRAV